MSLFFFFEPLLRNLSPIDPYHPKQPKPTKHNPSFS